MGLPSGRGPHSTPTPSPNQCGRGVLAVLSRVGTTTSELSKPPVGLKYYPEVNQGMPQSPPPRPLLRGGHPPPSNSGRPLSRCRPYYGCDPFSGGGLHACILATSTLQTSTGVSWGRSCVYHLQVMKLDIYEVPGSRLWKHQGEGVTRYCGNLPAVTGGNCE